MNGILSVETNIKMPNKSKITLHIRKGKLIANCFPKKATKICNVIAVAISWGMGGWVV